MKSLSISVLAVLVTTLGACQSGGVSPMASTRAIDLTSGQARTTIEVPQNDAVATTEAPYALQGGQTRENAVPPGIGYQAR